MSVSPPLTNFNREDLCKKARTELSLVMGFSNEDLVSIAQPHVNILIVTMCIGDFDVHRVMVNRGSRAKFMYPDLFKGLG